MDNGILCNSSPSFRKAEFIKRKSGRGLDGKLPDLGAQSRQDGEPVNEERGLAVSGLGQLLLRSREGNLGQRIAEDFVGPGEKLGGGGIFGGEILAHADGLGALTCEKRGDAFFVLNWCPSRGRRAARAELRVGSSPPRLMPRCG